MEEVRDMELCDKIAKLRKREGLSQEELAAKLEVSRQAVFKWESGETTPDLEKIKKLAKLFNVSFDILLDDDKEIGNANDVAVSHNKNEKEFKYRKTFDSGIKLNTLDLSNIEHGYANGKKKIEGHSFSLTSSRHKELIDKKGYTKTIKIQHDVCVDFFIDDNNKTFGFFYDGAPQFLCPFENFASFSMTGSGPSTTYTKAPVVGVGFGANPSIGVGSMPLSQTRSPLRYDCSISYFDENGLLKIYKIGFSCSRSYIVYDGTVKSQEDLIIWENMLSQNTNKNLAEVSTYLNGIKDAGLRIKSGEVSVSPIQTLSLSTEVKTGQDKKQSVKNNFSAKVEAANKRKKKWWLIAIIIVVAIVAGTITTCSITKAVEKNQLAETNKNRAQEVIDLIDAIGEVTLSSGPAITEAENAYSLLTSEQKALVYNQSVLTVSRNQYEKLLDDQREEATKNDPSRTIVVTDLNGRWASSTEEWAIANISGGTAVLYWVTGQMGGTVITGTLKSSYLVGYNNKTRKMDIKLYQYNMLGGNYLDVSMTKTSTNQLTLYYGRQTFYKTSNS